MLYLIRHGETAWNADGRFQGQQNTPLNEAGRTQARITARALADQHFDALYTSDLARAAQTAELIAAPHGLPSCPDDRLREVSFGEWEGLALPEIAVRWPELIAAWRADLLRTRPPGGETLEELQTRINAAVRDIHRRLPDGHVAIVAHGGSLRAIVTLALGADLSMFRRLRLDNCSLSMVKVDSEQCSLVLLNDICHLGSQTPRTTWEEAGDQWRLALRRQSTPS